MSLTKVNYAMITGSPINALDYGVSTSATGAANTTAFNLALTAAAGQTLYVPAGTYTISGGLTASANTTIVGYGATIQNTGTVVKLLTLASGCSVFGLSFVGTGSTYDDNGNGIYVTGTRNGAGVAPTYATDIRVENCTFNNLSGYGVQLLFVNNANIINNKITNVGYSGVMVYSCQNVLVDSNYIDTLTGENLSGQQNAYGVSFTANNATTDRVRDPVSRYCRAVNNLIKNIPTWHGLDTHGGWNIEFSNNQIIDCRRAAVLTNLGDIGSNYCTVQGNVAQNYLSGTNTSGSNKQSEAFWDIGATSTILNYGNRIVGNTTYQYGDPSTTSGVIFIQNAQDGEVSGNFIQNGYVSGIIVAGYVYRYGIRDNNIVDVQSASITTACVRFVNTVFNYIDVSHNTFSRKNTGLNTNVSDVGVLVANTASKSIAFYKNAFNAVTQKFYIPETTGLSGEITSTFTGTLTGLTTSPTSNVQYEINGTVATISIPLQTTGTSNAGTLTITGAPECLIPTNTQYNLTRVIDNGTTTLGIVRVASSTAVFTFNKNVTGDAFTSSGTKGVDQISFTYSLQ